MIFTLDLTTDDDPELFEFDPVQVASIKEASQIYGAIRDESQLGARDFPHGLITENGIVTYIISYNGKVWVGKPSVSGTPAYDPYKDRT